MPVRKLVASSSGERHFLPKKKVTNKTQGQTLGKDLQGNGKQIDGTRQSQEWKRKNVQIAGKERQWYEGWHLPQPWGPSGPELAGCRGTSNIPRTIFF